MRAATYPTETAVTMAPAATLHTARGTLVGVVALCSLWLGIVYVAMNICQSTYQMLMLIAIGTALVLPLLVLLLRGELDIFEPLVFANVALGSMFLGRPFFDISSQNWLHIWFSTYFDAQPGFDAMLMYALIGICALQIGYLGRLPQRLTRMLPAFSAGMDPEAAARIALIMFLIGAVLFEEYVRQSGGATFLLAYLTSRRVEYKAASGYLFIGPLFWPPAGLIAVTAWLRTRKPAHLTLAIVSLSCFFISMLGGVGRSFTLQGLLGVALIGYVVRGKRPSVLVIAPVIVIGLLYFVYEREARSALTFQDKQYALAEVIEHPSESILSIWDEDDAAMCDYLSVIVANVPERIGFGNGTSVTDSVLRAYPRFLWPGGQKPDEHMVALFKRLFPAIFYSYSSGAACSIIGEFYADHGGIVVLIGMYVLGVILAIPKHWLRATRGAIPAQLLFVAMPAYTISLMRGGIPAFIEYIAITTIPIILIAKYASVEVTGQGLRGN